MDVTRLRPGGLKLTKEGADCAGISAGSRVLDIGCGTGTTLRFLYDTYGCGVSGTDISEKAVAIAGKRVPEADICCADASVLPFPDATFDAVFMECTLTLFERPQDALSEAGRVLVKGGFLIIETLKRKDARVFLDDGAVSLPLLTAFLEENGFHVVCSEDKTEELVRFSTAIIFQYDSLDVYLKSCEKETGSSIFSCDMNRKGLGYHLIVAQRQ
ncbi:MAG: class I SAM-dependent methyltransferase [Lachnospiraceae bacterium]|nr:class I SAM-dependent methyltransferase [Lachnospiraceae bacterium]